VSEPSAGQLAVTLFAQRDDDRTVPWLSLVSRYLQQQLDLRHILPVGEPADGVGCGTGPGAADVAILLGNTAALDGRVLEHIEQQCAGGAGVVALGATSAQRHADRRFQWEVLGVELTRTLDHPNVRVELDAAARDHPVVTQLGWSVSRAAPAAAPSRLADDAAVLLVARRGDRREPVAWVRRHGLGRVFSTTLGWGNDSGRTAFLRLVAGAVAWTAGRELPAD